MAIQRSLCSIILPLFFAAGCGTAPHLRVDADVLNKITVENKLPLFDAENELNIAVNERDQLIDEIAQIKEDIRRARTKLAAAERDEEVFTEKNDVTRTDQALLRKDAAFARIDYLDARLEWARERLDRERRVLIVARARFELAKAKLVKKNNVPGASDIDIEDFEEQVTDLEEDVGETDDAIADAQAEMKAREQSWAEKSKALQAATGGALGSRWLD